MLDYLLFIRDKCRKTTAVDGFEHQYAEGWVTVQGVDEETRSNDATGREEVKSGNRSMSFGEYQRARYHSCKIQWLTIPLYRRLDASKRHSDQRLFAAGGPAPNQLQTDAEVEVLVTLWWYSGIMVMLATIDASPKKSSTESRQSS